MNDVRRTQGLRDTVESYMAEEVYRHLEQLLEQPGTILRWESWMLG